MACCILTVSYKPQSHVFGNLQLQLLMWETKNNSLSLNALSDSWSSASWSRIRFCSIASPLCCLQNRSSELFHPATHSVFFSVLSFIVGWSSFSKPGPPSPTPFSLSLSLLLYFWNMKEVINHSELKITLNLIYQILS